MFPSFTYVDPGVLSEEFMLRRRSRTRIGAFLTPETVADDRLNPEEALIMRENSPDEETLAEIERVEDEIICERATLLMNLVDKAVAKNLRRQKQVLREHLAALRKRDGEPDLVIAQVGRRRTERLLHPVVRRSWSRGLVGYEAVSA